MTKMQKFKSWTKENAENIAVGTVLFLTGTGFVAVMVAAVKDDNRRQAEATATWNELIAHEVEVENAVTDEHNAGNFVYALLDGSYLAVPAGAKQKLIK
jgi:hypothetical protein